ncbi:orc1/cdc6 family replication initiation protein [Halogeometricum sp. S1BR25-6]|uniref:Orc1/cdc6 family replication initiation protein n=1 Tax=Halogeometricum salsisoli TaxID=2950536 RepID=A0ABU2GK37_9EURY|nr:orc1/cdc6 family replication initiation protein [Halogeometricum sp. S1BR25-6]MDS0301188.1 orc1/cdc6 family replication initiation protein [Halogeometricum sp. S1BR25-6]
MITDARVLQPEFTPQEVEHRNQEVNVLSNALKPIMNQEPGETTLLLGPSGAGKTCIARFTTERLRENVLDINSQYINCWQDYTRFRVLYRILEGIGQTVDIHRRSTPKDELLDRLCNYDGPHYVIILDEVDQLEDKSVLYDLYQMRGLTAILITNREEDLFSHLDDRLTSRFESSVRVNFDKYHLDELVSILEARARWGLSERAIGRQQLALIADAAAGDARIAIGILRNAARQADQQGTEMITTDIVEGAVPDGRAEVRRKAAEKLRKHQRVLFEILTDEGEMKPGELYDEYCRRVDDPKTKRTVRNYLQKMEHYRLIIADGKKRARTYRPRTDLS